MDLLTEGWKKFTEKARVVSLIRQKKLPSFLKNIDWRAQFAEQSEGQRNC